MSEDRAYIREFVEFLNQKIQEINSMTPVKYEEQSLLLKQAIYNKVKEIVKRGPRDTGRLRDKLQKIKDTIGTSSNKSVNDLLDYFINLLNSMIKSSYFNIGKRKRGDKIDELQGEQVKKDMAVLRPKIYGVLNKCSAISGAIVLWIRTELLSRGVSSVNTSNAGKLPEDRVKSVVLGFLWCIIGMDPESEKLKDYTDKFNRLQGEYGDVDHKDSSQIQRELEESLTSDIFHLEPTYRNALIEMSDYKCDSKNTVANLGINKPKGTIVTATPVVKADPVVTAAPVVGSATKTGGGKRKKYKSKKRTYKKRTYKKSKLKKSKFKKHKYTARRSRK